MLSAIDRKQATGADVTADADEDLLERNAGDAKSDGDQHFAMYLLVRTVVGTMAL